MFYENKRALLTISHPNTVTDQEHLHSEIEIMYCRSGGFDAVIDRKSVHVSEGSFSVAFPNQSHYYLNGEPGAKFSMIIFSTQLTPEMSSVFLTSVPESAVLPVKNRERFELLFEELLNCADKNDRYSIMRSDGLLKQIIADLFEPINFISARISDSSILADVINYCYNNYRNDITLADLENELHTTRYYISHLFKSKLHVTFSNYIHSLRTKEACRLLKDTNDSITNISFSVGYNTVRSFNRCFVAEIGMTPGQYRTNSRNKDFKVTNEPSGDFLC